MEAADVHELTGGAVGLGGIEDERTSESEDARNGLGEFANGDIFASADIDKRRFGVGQERVEGGRVKVEQVDTGRGEVVGIEQLPAGGAGSPDGDLGGTGADGFGGLADESREDVRVGEVEVVVWAVEVGGHGGQVPGAVLAVVAPAHLDPGDLGEGVGAVGGLEGAGEEAGLGHGLGGELGVDAGGAEEEEAVDAGLPRGLDHVGLDDEVVADEVGGVGVVGEDAADPGGGENDVLGPLLLEEAGDRGGVEEVELGVGAGEEVGVAEAGKFALDGGADQATVAGDVDAGIERHVGCRHGLFPPGWTKERVLPLPPYFLQSLRIARVRSGPSLPSRILVRPLAMRYSLPLPVSPMRRALCATAKCLR